MYFITLLLFILVPSLLLRYLNFLLGRNPTTPEFPRDSFSTNTPSSALELVPNIQPKPSSSSSSSIWEHEEVLVDFPNIQTKPSSSSSSSNWEYDVFLSFRGEDTRNAFTDHLYDCMNRNGIDTFRDTENLPRGKSISPQLLKAIEESMFAVIVLSTNYATSTWCLDELAHILENKKLRGLEVLPVFYHVEPSEIRKQTGNYGKAFAKHEERFKENTEKVNKWRKALKDVTDFSGWHVTQGRSEKEVIQEITNYVSKAVGLSIPQNHLIGMDSRIREVESRLNLGSNDVLTVGIWGMGGIGKTTLAKEVFNEIREQFHPSGFVSQVRLQSEIEFLRLLCKSFPGNGNIDFDTRERGIKLLKKALCKKKVLIVLDDVDDFTYIKCLAPGEPLGLDTWGGGSRLIITSRDRSVWRDFSVTENQIYEVEKLSDEEAYQLLCQKAFKKDNPPDEFVALSKGFLQYAGGIPLAHEVLGSYLSEQNVDEWSEILHRLDDDKDKDIFSVLQISFDGLQDTDKKIFLDIACFFNGEDHVRVKKILEGCGFSVKIGIRNLINKALIKIESKNELWMHDLLRCLGWHIVREESPLPGTRSTLWVDYNSYVYERRMSWRIEDARNVLEENTGTTAVEGLFLSLPEKEEMCLNNDPFLTMRNLRLLKICNVNFLNVNFTYLSKKLRFLEWHECPLEILSSCFEPDQLVEFKMPNSRIKLLWNEKLSLKMLILMDLSDCQYLTKTLDFSKVPKLERLILKGCKELSEVHPTIGNLQHLILLNLKGCESLESLPQSISLRSLRTCILSGCSKLRHFPKIVGNMDSLSELCLDGTAIWKLPVSIQHLRGLILLNLSGCKNLLNLPSVLCSSLTSLKFLYLSLCSSMEELPENIGCLKHLEELDACDTAIREVPESISGLKNLKLLCFHGCSRWTGLELPNLFSGLRSLTTLNLGGCNLAEGAIPDDIGNLFSLQSLDLSENNFSTIPESISQLSELTEISLFRCSKLQSLPKDLPSSLKNVDVRYCPMLLTSSSYGWRRWASQKGLSIINCRNPEDELELHKFPLESLQELNLSNCQHLTKIPDLNEVRYLKKLILEGCEKLSEVHPTIGDLQYLVLLNLKGCVDLESLPHSISLKSLEVFILSGCSKLKVFPDIKGDMKNLSQLHLDGTALRDLPISMQQLKGLVLLNLRGCRNLTTIPNLLSLTSLNLSGCLRIFKLLENLGMLAKLQELDVSETVIRYVHRSISLLKNLKVLSFGGCKGLQLPNWFSDLRSLTSLNLRRCGLTEEVLDLLCCLSTLQILDLSTNNFASIPNEIDRLSSLHLLDLSENNFVSIPESISQLSELTELRLFRCSKLQSLPRNLPFNLKHVDARECLMLKNNADTLTILASGKGFCFINCGQADQDKDHPSNVPVPKEGLEVLFHKYIEDGVYGEKPFELRFPHSRSSPHLWNRWTSGPSVTIPLADSYSLWIGFALFVVFEILQKDNFDESWELEETICDFYTHNGRHENSLVFQNFINFRNGSTYGLCHYEPRGGQFGRLSPLLRASVSTKRPDLIVRACGIHLITQGDAPEFVQNLTYQTVTQHLDFNFSRYCEEILYETMTGDLMELGSTSIVNEDSCSESNSNNQPRGDLPILYEGHNGRRKGFYFCFPAPVISIPPWFFNHHAGDVTLCQITENLLDDQTWVGVELYVIFTRHLPMFASRNGNNNFFFHVDLCAHDHERMIMHGSLNIHSFLGISDQLVVLHVPRVHFRQQLNECQGISALFRTVGPEMEVLVCGSRLVFEQDLKALMHSLTVALGDDPIHIAQTVDQRNAVEGERPMYCNSSFQRLNQSLSSCRKRHRCFLYQRNAMEEEVPINCNSFQRITAQVLPEQAPTSSIMRLQNYGCYLQQDQGFRCFHRTPLIHSTSVMLVHSKGCVLINKDSNQENVAEELLACDPHVHIMAETLLYGSYSSQQWKRCIQLLLRRHFKVATLSLGGHSISALKNFKNPSATYNICFSDKEIPEWFKDQMYGSRVGITLPPKLYDDNNWRGLVICARFSVDDQRLTTYLVKLVCHLRAKDYCMDPIPMCSITKTDLESLHPGKFIWLTYIPRVFLTEFNMVSDVEATIHINCPGLTVDQCGIRLLYRHEDDELNKVITDCWTSFFDNLSLILRGHIMDFDRDLIYNAIAPSNKIPEWFGKWGHLHDKDTIEFQLPPSPSVCSDEDWIGLALCATFYHWNGQKNNYIFTSGLHTQKKGLYFNHKYETNSEECKSLRRCGPDRRLIWLSYIPRRWFLHHLNDESVLFASLKEDGWKSYTAGHGFVYEHNVEEFKQLCINLHQLQKSE